MTSCVTRTAEEAGLAVPHTEEATDAALAGWSGPVVVKARIHVPTRYETRRFESAELAAPFVADLRSRDAEPLLQECITGQLGAVVVVVDRDGQVVAEVQQRCDRSWPAEAGVTARASTIAPDAELSERIGELVRRLEWFGLAEIEYLLDDRGVPRFTELNGRFYGGLALAGRAGVNVAAVWARLAMGESVTPLPPQRVGARFQWLNRDLAASFHADGLRGMAAALALAPRSAHSLLARGDPVRCCTTTFPKCHGAPRPGPASGGAVAEAAQQLRTSLLLRPGLAKRRRFWPPLPGSPPSPP